MKKKITKSAATAKNKKIASHKLGPDKGGTPKRLRQLDRNFKQSRDVREDRGVRQVKSAPKNQNK